MQRDQLLLIWLHEPFGPLSHWNHGAFQNDDLPDDAVSCYEQTVSTCRVVAGSSKFDTPPGDLMKTRIRDIRRKDLQRVAFDILAEEGFHGLTLGKVAERLGMSRGLVHHYFRDKDELLEAAVRYGNRLISEQIGASLRRCKTPRERLAVICEGNFDQRMYIASRAQYWISYCAQATFSARFARLLNIQNSRMQSNLLHELRILLAPAEAERAAEVISMLMDGIWLRLAVTKAEPTREAAIDMLANLLGQLLGSDRDPPTQTISD
ncbi:transcriptional regulator BetI [Mesorhizobium sp. CA7]|uniref:transcriptional regulator BetI n=1 Tax=Mesorhizobium sp. CA7 TaxID=588501 RepID=UPI001CC9C0A0|nr:transcriptional regulator BetI [Mesorhizobium sp. CA7]MBZ9813845.1 transcriptional regulator BetI [Mesorhizobium sp. CA7]